jgi:hypothetical protein
MQELRLVAVSEDGSYLVLATAGRGTRFTLPVDDRLRAAVRGHFSRLGQFEIEVESPLRPKEIQARIRAGETAEEIAESAGIPVERVRWFEGPVLQEREYMAQQAQRVIARRQGDASPGPPLGEMVEERLGRRGVDLEEVEWDSWKCEDSTWRVRLSFFDDGRPHAAEWVFDPRRRQVSPLDEEAARLSSLVLEEPAAPTVTALVSRRPAMKIVSDSRSDVAAEQRREYGVGRGRIAEPRRQSVAPHRREYVAPPEEETVAATRERYVPEVAEPYAPEPAAAPQEDLGATGYAAEVESPAQDDGVTESSSATVAEPEWETPAAQAVEPPRPIVTEVATEVVTEAPREVVAKASPEPAEQPRAEPREEVTAVIEPAPEPPAAASVAEVEDVRPEPAPQPAARRDPQAAPKPKPKPEPVPEPEPVPVEPVAAEAEEEQVAAAAVPKPAPAPPPPVEPPARPVRRKNSARGKRASVPSWDEIMFGARRPD